MKKESFKSSKVSKTIWLFIYLTTILLVFISLFWTFNRELFTTILNFAVPIFSEKQFFIYLAVGFIAQLIDGALGMAYGITSVSFLISTGVPPAIASTSVHIAEVFTTGASGISHWKMGHVNKKLFLSMAIPAALGAGVGAYFLSSFDGNIIKPYISAYLFIMGIIIIFKAFKKIIRFKKIKHIKLLSIFGGFVDASGGGGWGPVMTTTLISSGHHPKHTIGTVNAVEFLVALTASGVFVFFLGLSNLSVIFGLIIGGIIAAPLGAYFLSKINIKIAMIMVGLLVVLLSTRIILLSLNII